MNDPQYGRDGTYNGIDAEPGVYVYATTFLVDGEMIIRAGDVTWLR